MLSQDERRQLAAIEHGLRRTDPSFAVLMGDTGSRRRFPLASTVAAGLIWLAAVTMLAAGWWQVAIVVAVWATVISGALVYRWRPSAGRG